MRETFEHPPTSFRDLVSLSEDRLDLATAALSIARDEYPELSMETYLAEIEALTVAARRHVGAVREPRQVARRLNQLLFDREGFRGNVDDYYDPRNSYLNEVLDRRTGIPITLSLLYMEIGRRLGHPVEGIGLPGHFIVRIVAPDEFYVDPFNRGNILGREDCVEKVRKLFGTPVEDSPELFARATKSQILARMLNNLKAIYVRQERFEKALTVIDKLLAVDPRSPQELRDRALVLVRLRRYTEALRQLEKFLATCPADEETQPLREEAVQVLTWLRQVN